MTRTPRTTHSFSVEGVTKNFRFGRPRDVEGPEITFEQVVRLAFDNPPFGADTIFSVTYRKGGNEHRPEGVMVEGDSVKVKKGTTFNVSATNRS